MNNLITKVAENCLISPTELQEVLMKTVLPSGTKPEQVTAFLAVAHQYGLNPLTREIYAFPAKGGGIQTILSVDGWNKIMNAHPQFDGVEFEHHRSEQGAVESVTCHIYRKDRQRPTTVTEYLAECNTGSQPWKQYPNRMLRHAARKQCMRVAFGLSGVAPEPEQPEEEPAPKVVNPEQGRLSDLRDRLEAVQTPEEFEEVRAKINGYRKTNGISGADLAILNEIKGEVADRLGLEAA